MLSICRELLSNQMELVVVDGALVSGFQLFLACHNEVCWVLFCSSFMPVKCLSWKRTDYMPMLMTPLLAVVRKPADRPAAAASLTGTWLGLRSGAIIGAWYWIQTKLRLQWLVNQGLWTLHLVTWSCLGFSFALVPTSIFLAWSLTAGSHSKTMCVVLSLVSLKELVFSFWWSMSL